MQAYRPILNQQRLQRYVLWALVLLAWVGEVLSGVRSPKQRHIRQRGDIDLVRLVKTLIMARALNMLRCRQHGRAHTWRHGRNLRPSHFMRSLFGAELRRAFKHRDNPTRIAQIIAILHNLDAYAAKLVQRVRRLRRLLRTAPAIAGAAAILGPPAPSPALSDSS